MKRIILLGFAVLLAGCTEKPLEIGEWRGTEDGYHSYDGVFYNWVDAEGRKGMKCWVPPEAEPVRGIIIHGKPGSGGGGDTRSKTRDRALQEFAARFNFGIIGVTWFEGPEVYPEKTGLTILRVLNEWAGLGQHPELKNVPLIARGNSNSALFTYGLAALIPDRIICFTPNVGPWYEHAEISDAFLQVPGILHVGPNDPFFTNGMAGTEALFDEVAPKGALWAWTAEQGKGHEIRHCVDVDFAFYETCIGLRYPPRADPRRGPVKLQPLKREDGWLVDLASWESGITYIAPYDAYDRDKTKAGWVPTKDIAYLYRGLATYNNPLKLSLNVPEIVNEKASGVYLDTKPGALVYPGDRVLVQCDASAYPDWRKMELFNGARLLGAVERGQKPEWSVTIESQYAVYAFCAVATGPDGEQRTGYPLHLIVADPALAPGLELSREMAEYEPVPETMPEKTGTGIAGTSVEWTPDTKQILPAYGLTAEQEQGFARDGKVSAFWSALDYDTVPTMSAGSSKMKVKAAHSRAGLYLLFEIEDDAWDEGDGLDFHIAWQNPDTIFDHRDPSVFSKAGQYSLLRRERQYHLPVKLPVDPAHTVSWNYTDPWDIANKKVSLGELENHYRSVVDIVEIADNRRAVEWFMPWTFVGTKGPMEEPAAGERLAVVLGYNDKDGGDKIRWPHGLDPWAVKAVEAGDIKPWGSMIIIP